MAEKLKEMTKNQAIKLARYHKFTKLELYNILKEALEKLNDDFWKKPNRINSMTDNGYYFNRCVEWVGYIKGENDNDYTIEVIVVRVLEVFGKFSKIQLPKKTKKVVKINNIVSEIPKL